jgi:uncharacterized phage protein gp47/JayE
MTFVRPTLSDLVARNRADIDARMPGADSRLRRNALDVLAIVHAGAVHSLYGMIDARARFFPDPDNAEAIARWSALKGVPRKASAPATGNVALTGTDGSDVPAGAILARSDGARYIVQAEVTIAAGVATAVVEAELPGIAGAMDEGQPLTFLSPIAGVAAIGVVAAGGLAGAADEESDAELSARIYEAMRRPPSGGKASDYIAWAKSVPAVTRAWVYENWDGLGTVKLLFVCDGRDDIIPESGDIEAVEAIIATERPVCADVTVAGPIADPLDLTIDLTPAETAVQDAVEASLRDLIAREAEPGGTLLISRIREAISIAAGETDHVLTTPSANVTAAAGEITTLGTITWS